MKYHYHFSGVSTIVNGEEFRFVSELERVAVSRVGHVLTATKLNGMYRGDDSRRGYRFLRRNGRTIYVHQLVYELFVEQIPEGLEIDHINTIRDDNRVENLRVVTRLQNLHNPITEVRRHEALVRATAAATAAKLKPIIGRAPGGEWDIGPFPSVKDAAVAIGLPSASSISSALHGSHKTAGGYEWKFYSEEDFHD